MSRAIAFSACGAVYDEALALAESDVLLLKSGDDLSCLTLRFFFAALRLLRNFFFYVALHGTS